MINSVSQVNRTIYPMNTAIQSSISCPNFQSIGFDELQLQNNNKKKKSHKVLAWIGGITAAIAACAVIFNPVSRMRFLNLFRKQASEETINNAIRKYAKEMANLDKEKKIFINPKTGKLVYSVQGIEHEVRVDELGHKFFGKTIIGHNHPGQVVCGRYFNDTSFSLQDLRAGLLNRNKHEFVVTQKHIHHITYNGNYDDKKFLDYLVNNGLITLKDRKPETIFNEIHGNKFDFDINWSNAEVIEKHYSRNKRICDAMGWTYWREPLPI